MNTPRLFREAMGWGSGPSDPRCTCKELEKSHQLCPVCDKEKYDKAMRDAEIAKQPRQNSASDQKDEIPAEVLKKWEAEAHRLYVDYEQGQAFVPGRSAERNAHVMACRSQYLKDRKEMREVACKCFQSGMAMGTQAIINSSDRKPAISVDLRKMHNEQDRFLSQHLSTLFPSTKKPDNEQDAR